MGRTQKGIISSRVHAASPGKLATLGAALRLETGTRVLDLGSGSGRCCAPGLGRVRADGVVMGDYRHHLRRRAGDIREAGQPPLDSKQ